MKYIKNIEFFKILENVDPSSFDPIKSFYLKDSLNRDVWDGFVIKPDVREDLIQIAKDYQKYLELDDIELDDIIFTGSLANFNWSDYSDFDVHLVFDFSQINEDEELVKKLLDSLMKLWKNQHDLTLIGYEVELYCQNSSEKHISTGQYSLLNDEWIKKPSKENFVPDEELIKMKASVIMDTVDEIEDKCENKYDYESLQDDFDKVWKKIKDNRQRGLNKDGEFSIENLVFKLMRRNGYIEKLLTLKSKIYDKQYK